MMSNYRNQVTQGQFSFLPDLTDEEITLQIKYALDQGYAINVEYTDDPHPRNTYWEMFGFPMFDMKDPAGVMVEVQACRKTFSNCYIRVMASDATRGTESQKMASILPLTKAANISAAVGKSSISDVALLPSCDCPKHS